VHHWFSGNSAVPASFAQAHLSLAIFSGACAATCDSLFLEIVMKFRHSNRVLRRIDEDLKFTGGYSSDVVNLFRRRMQLIRESRNENDLRNLRSLHFEKLKGQRKHQRSIRLNDQYRLILEIEKREDGNVAVIVEIVDYHP
jgi:proteic killer suppression protein